jgi:KTSC domain
MTMTTICVEFSSTSLAKASYDRSRAFLQIHFKDGSIYRYSNLPDPVFQAFIAAPSTGIFFNRYIRNQFSCIRIQHEN